MVFDQKALYTPFTQHATERDFRPPESPLLPPALQETLEWLIREGDFDTARGLAHRIFGQLAPNDPRATDFLARTLERCAFHEEAAQYALQTVKLAPNSLEARMAASAYLRSAQDPARAEEVGRDALVIWPDSASVQLDLGLSLEIQGRYDESLPFLERALALYPPGDAGAKITSLHLGWHKLRLGCFKEGIADYLAIGRELGVWGWTHDDPRPRLEPGMNVAGKKVCLRGEGGLGDEFINARFARVIRERGGSVVWATSRTSLASVLARVDGISRVLTIEEARHSGHDLWAPCMDLPRSLGLDADELPSEPYLSADPSYIRKWAAAPAGNNLRVGVRWASDAAYERGLDRSVPFKLLESLAELPGVALYSLQRDGGSEQRPDDSPVADWGSRLETWEDTAGAIANLDLVITSCTSVAHLAAGMGKPTWVFCPILSYYLWALDGPHTPWYPSVRLFKRTRPGDWSEPFALLREALSELLAAGSVARLGH